MDFFKFFLSKQSTKDVAKERLKLILIHDRATSALTPELLEQIKEELLIVISKYVEFDPDELDVKMTKVNEGEDGISSALIASIPFKNMRPKV